MVTKEKSAQISVVGLGKLGVCLAACLAHKKFNVIGYDVNPHTVALVAKRQAPVREPRLQELLKTTSLHLRATTDARVLMEETRLTFIVVPTPSLRNGSFSDAYVRTFFATISPFLKHATHHHTFVVVSTVLPGTLARLIAQLEKDSGKKINKDFSVCYNPEFIALGSVIANTLEPDLVLIGESNKEAGYRVEEIYRRLCDNTPRIARMSIVSAEVTKIALNAYVTMKISFANTLGNLCERISGTDVDAITTALGADRRISPYYLKAGTAYGGPCFPRDSKAFSAFARNCGLRAPLAEAADTVNNFQVKDLIQKIERELKTNKHRAISFLGLSYKPKTPVIEESVAVKMIEYLSKKYPRLKIYAYDPLANAVAENMFGKKIVCERSMKACLTRSALWVITTPEAEFKTIRARHATSAPTAIIDCWRLLDSTKLGKNIVYHQVGVFPK